MLFRSDSVFGLGAAVFTRDREKGERIAAEELEAGSCFVNGFVRSDPRLPFGGIKESGYGRELGQHALGVVPQQAQRRSEQHQRDDDYREHLRDETHRLLLHRRERLEQADADADHQPAIKQLFARLLDLQAETGDKLDLRKSFPGL